MKGWIILIIILVSIFVIVGPILTTTSPTTIPVCDGNANKNTFYPGINWKEGDQNLTHMANCLDSTLRKSYMNTGIVSGTFQTLLAYLKIPTKENYLSTNEGDGDYTIAFAHSGGTQTLVRKIETGNVTVNYAVLAAPALLEQEQLAKLIKEKKIRKKVIILQSKRDILYQLMIGSASRNFQWKLFVNQSIDDNGKYDIIALTDEFPEIKKGLSDSIDVHGALRDKMITMFLNGEYPFDGSFEGLKKK